jgi:hypothetical protein
VQGGAAGGGGGSSSSAPLKSLCELLSCAALLPAAAPVPARDHARPVCLVGWLQAMSNNYFLWIIVVISVLAVLSKLTGAI